MMRFYGLTDRDCLRMPFPRLLLLYDKINLLETEEEIRDLVTVHAGDPQLRLRQLQEHLYEASPTTVSANGSERIESRAGFVEYADANPTAFDDAFAAVRARQQAADAARRAEWEAHG